MLFSARHRIAMFVCPELAWIIASCRSEIRALNTANAQIVEERDQALQSEPSLDHELRKRLLGIEHIIKLAQDYSAHKKLTLATVSTYAANDGKLFKRLEEGAGCTIKRADYLMDGSLTTGPMVRLIGPLTSRVPPQRRGTSHEPTQRYPAVSVLSERRDRPQHAVLGDTLLGPLKARGVPERGQLGW